MFNFILLARVTIPRTNSTGKKMNGDNIYTLFDRLVSDLEQAKNTENKAREKRIKAEEKLIAHIQATEKLPEEGSKTTRGITYKVRVTNKLSRLVDWGMYQQTIADMGLPSSAHPVRLETKFDFDKLELLKKDHPDSYASICNCIAVKPLKPQVSFDHLEDQN